MDRKRMKKGKRWLWVLGVVIIVIIAAVVVLPSLMPAQTVSNIQSTAAAMGGISETVVGVGTLESENEDEAEIKIPTGITISEVYAESGDEIEKGEVLAVIDSLSLQNRIAAVQSEISSLDARINNSRNDTDEIYIRAGVSGRVKKIYTEKDESVFARMRESGMLMLISIDGKMAVDIEATAILYAGDEVTAILEDGSEKTGEVAKTTDTGYTITLTDNGPKLDEIAEVADKDGNTLGRGVLYINQPIAIIGSSGTVKTIHVSENERISKDRRLITLENTPPTAEHLLMMADRTELVDMLNILLALSETNTIVSEVDGTILNVYVSDNTNTGDGMATGSSTTAGNGTAAGGDSLLMVGFVAAQSESVILTVEIDELDILSIQEGQEATVVFNALPDEEFIGVISQIASSSHSQSGVAKYAVDITLDKNTSLPTGMNATANINISSKTDILTLPIEALQESAGRVFVYTEKDESTGILSGEKEVQTGISDGIMVEIISGLTDGETVYYTLKTSSSTTAFGPGGGGMGGGMGGGER